MILAGDIGGTKSNIGLFDVQNGKLALVAHERYLSHQHAGLQEIVQDFLTKSPAKIDAASFGVAGPVVDNRVHGTNLPWIVDGAAAATQLGLPRVRILNDLEATAFGVGVLAPSDLVTIYEGVPLRTATCVVIAAGTGLGEAILFWDGKQHLAMGTEGGHADFAPHTPQQAKLWEFLRARLDYVSAEIILSGRGFQNVHEFLDPSVKHPGFDDPMQDPAPGITQRGLSGECPVCAATLDLWTEIYGSEAGNFTVRTLARGGIYVAGGIAVKVLPKLKDGRFAAAARDKEKMRDFLAHVPIYVVLNEEAPLLGAAYVASKGL
ncbi:MAG TPA: glucokinase [Candidatus Acidoferrales bacterium]|jgi:glucokinase|nr:glucokinase [Candidatus Acidoferrales bacterium]